MRAAYHAPSDYTCKGAASVLKARNNLADKYHLTLVNMRSRSRKILIAFSVVAAAAAGYAAYVWWATPQSWFRSACLSRFNPVPERREAGLVIINNQRLAKELVGSSGYLAVESRASEKIEDSHGVYLRNGSNFSPISATLDTSSTLEYSFEDLGRGMGVHRLSSAMSRGESITEPTLNGVSCEGGDVIELLSSNVKIWKPPVRVLGSLPGFPFEPKNKNLPNEKISVQGIELPSLREMAASSYELSKLAGEYLGAPSLQAERTTRERFVNLALYGDDITSHSISLGSIETRDLPDTRLLSVLLALRLDKNASPSKYLSTARALDDGWVQIAVERALVSAKYGALFLAQRSLAIVENPEEFVESLKDVDDYSEAAFIASASLYFLNTSELAAHPKVRDVDEALQKGAPEMKLISDCGSIINLSCRLDKIK